MPLLKTSRLRTVNHGWAQESSHLPQHKLTARCQETKTNPAWVTIQNILVKEERNTPMIRMLALDLLHSSELRPRVFFYNEKWTRLKRPGDVEGRWGSSRVVAKMIRACSSSSQMTVEGGDWLFMLLLTEAGQSSETWGSERTLRMMIKCHALTHQRTHRLAHYGQRELGASVCVPVLSEQTACTTLNLSHKGQGAPYPRTSSQYRRGAGLL